MTEPSITPEAARAQAEAALDGYENAARVEDWADPLARAVTALLSVFPEPPTTNDREAAESLWPVMKVGYSDSDGSRFEYESGENRRLREAYLAGVTARRPSPPTDEQVEAAAVAIFDAAEGGVWMDQRIATRDEYLREARAALEAADRVGGTA